MQFPIFNPAKSASNRPVFAFLGKFFLSQIHFHVFDKIRARISVTGIE